MYYDGFDDDDDLMYSCYSMSSCQYCYSMGS
jgi:hypothetical protein